MALPQSQAATSPPDEQLDRRLQLAVHAARLAGQQTLRWFCQDHLRVERKGDGTPVTAADRGAEELLRTLISQEFPEDAILGEEFGEQAGSSPYRWVLDPIDGTKAFITGVPLYTTLVGVLQDEQPRLGVIHSPATGELIYASPGQGVGTHVVNRHLAGCTCRASVIFRRRLF
jgi:fructose-1,6-bisphosphatase/inositol monophosphatase family enzyme